MDVITYVWVGSNVNGQILKSDIPQLNGILKINNNNLKFE
jgi:hypothetical protein